jgi:hypothetical protein
MSDPRELVFNCGRGASTVCAGLLLGTSGETVSARSVTSMTNSFRISIKPASLLATTGASRPCLVLSIKITTRRGSTLFIAALPHAENPWHDPKPTANVAGEAPVTSCTVQLVGAGFGESCTLRKVTEPRGIFEDPARVSGRLGQDGEGKVAVFGSCVRIHGVLSFERLGRAGGELSRRPGAAHVFKAVVSWLAPCRFQVLRSPLQAFRG